MTDTDAITDIRVEIQRADGETFGFWIVGTRAGSRVILGNIGWLSGSPCHVQTEAEAHIWAQLFAGSLGLLREAQAFCRRVESGEIRSKRSYEAFKAAIKQATTT